MKKNILLLVTFLFFIPEILADKRAPKGQCYISIGYVSDRDSVTEFAKKSFIKAKDFELFERKDKKVYLTLGKIDKNIFNKLESEGETYNFNCSSGKGYEERFGLNSEFQIVGGNKINIISAQQFMSVVSSIEIEKQRLFDLEVEKQVQAKLAAEKEKQRLAMIEEQRKAERAAEIDKQIPNEASAKEQIKKDDISLNLSSVKSIPTKYSCSNSYGFEDYTFNDEQRTAKIKTNFSDKPIIKEFKFLDKNKELIEINYPEIAKKYPSMSSRTVLNRVTGKKDAYSVEKLNNTVDCSIVAEETPEEKSQAARKAEDEKVITETRTKDELLKYISSKKWQVSGLPCTLNGGTYQLFSSRFKVGWNMAAQGKLIKETANNASYTTKPIDGKTFRHEITIFSGGNQMVTNALGTPNAKISYSIDEYKLLDENTMQKTSIDNRQINFDLMMKGAYQLDNTAEIGKVTIVKACNL